jgi:signal transduction histidine kinase
LELQRGSVDLAALLREICNRQRTLTPEFELDLALPAITAPIEGDARLLEQVFSNLVSNAIKYSGASRRIDLALIEGVETVEFTIRDHGVGIPPLEIPKLFMRFFRASTANGIAGTGIGLHLVKELVTMHGGGVAVDSVLGRGSLFRVVLPRRLPVAHGRDLGSG